MTRTAYLVRAGRLVGGVCCAALALAACGSGSGSASHTPASNGVASKSPAQVIAAAQQALRSAKGYVGVGTLDVNGTLVKIQFAWDANSRMSLQVHQGHGRMKTIVVRHFTYIYGNAAFWNMSAGHNSGAAMANRWVEVPPGKHLFSSSLEAVAPRILARCLGENHGTLSRTGTTVIDGRRAVVIYEAGNVPGGGPGYLAVAMNGPAYPLRLTSTGRARPGGRVDVCNDGKGGNTRGTLTLSHFGDPPAIKPPAHTVIAGKRSGSSV